MTKSNIHFTGIFKDEFENYIDYKQSQGYYKSLYKKNIYELLNYNRYLDSLNLKEIKITEEMITKYMESLNKHHIEKMCKSQAVRIGVSEACRGICVRVLANTAQDIEELFSELASQLEIND